MKIIYGVVQPDAGHDPLGRRGRSPSRNPAQARELGIGMVFQHFSLFETLTVAENIALALDPARRRWRPGRRASATVSRALRPAARSAPPRARAVGGRAPARRDRPLPAAGPAPADHGRADLGADAAGGARSCSRPCASWPPRAAASSTSATSSTRSRRSATRATVLRGGKVTGTCDPRQETPRVAGADDDRRATCRHAEHGAAHGRRRGARCVVDGPVAAPPTTRSAPTCKRHQPGRARRRDRRHRRRLRQRPEGAARGAVRRAHRSPMPTRCSI